jgi:hypothetical protein
MFLIETCKHCPVCTAVTPHTRRWFSLALFLAVLLVSLAASMFFVSPPEPATGFIFLFLALVIVARDRERMWRVHCNRCRERARQPYENSKPDLKNTEINIF